MKDTRGNWFIDLLSCISEPTRSKLKPNIRSSLRSQVGTDIYIDSFPLEIDEIFFLILPFSFFYVLLFVYPSFYFSFSSLILLFNILYFLNSCIIILSSVLFFLYLVLFFLYLALFFLYLVLFFLYLVLFFLYLVLFFLYLFFIHLVLFFLYLVLFFFIVLFYRLDTKRTYRRRRITVEGGTEQERKLVLSHIYSNLKVYTSIISYIFKSQGIY